MLDSSFVRINIAAKAIGRKPATVRYHARKHKWEKIHGYVRAIDVEKLKTYLDEYYVEGFNPQNPTAEDRMNKKEIILAIALAVLAAIIVETVRAAATDDNRKGFKLILEYEQR